MTKYIVEIKGEIIGDYEIIDKCEEAFYFFDNKYLYMFTCSRCFMPEPQINEFYTKQIAFCAFCGRKITHKDKGDAAPELIRGVERRLDRQMKTFTEGNARSSEA